MRRGAPIQVLPLGLRQSNGLRRFHAFRQSLRAQRLNLHPPG